MNIYNIQNSRSLDSIHPVNVSSPVETRDDPRWGARAREGFSLIELLSVVAVIGLMLGLLVPAMSGFRSTYERRQATGAVMDTLERARVAALQSGEDVHVVFARPTDEGMAEDAMIIVGEPPLGSLDTRRIFHSKWIKLPKGVRFRGAPDSLAAPALPTPDLADGLPGIGGNPAFSALTFNSSGQVKYPAGGNLYLALFEGIRGGATERAGGGSGQATLGLSDSGQYEVIRLSRYSGRARMDVGTLEHK